MVIFRWELLPPVHQTILNGVNSNPGQLTRSELAKIAVGSVSVRVSGFSNLEGFGELAGFGRKAITEEIDILLQQKYLALDREGKLILGEMSYSVAEGEDN